MSKINNCYLRLQTFCANGIADDVSEDMKEFLDFLKERSTKNKFTKELADAVDQVRRNEGDSLRLISLIQKKIQKSKVLETIADELEETPDSIRSIYDLIRQHPDKSAEEILECMED